MGTYAVDDSTSSESGPCTDTSDEIIAQIEASVASRAVAAHFNVGVESDSEDPPSTDTESDDSDTDHVYLRNCWLPSHPTGSSRTCWVYTYGTGEMPPISLEPFTGQLQIWNNQVNYWEASGGQSGWHGEY